MSYAIETYYDGYYFRSKTEARWAVFLNQLNVEYQYEPDCFEFELLHNRTVRYLPDFYLPESDVYLEVKGFDPSEQDLEKVELLCEHEEKSCIIAIGSPDINNDATVGVIQCFFWYKATDKHISHYIHEEDCAYLYYYNNKLYPEILEPTDRFGLMDMRKAAAISKAWRFDERGELTDEQIQKIRNKVIDTYSPYRKDLSTNVIRYRTAIDIIHERAKAYNSQNQGDLFGKPKLP